MKVTLAVVGRLKERYLQEAEAEYAKRGWKMHPSLDRVYVNDRARRDLGWQPKYDFRFLISHLRHDAPIQSELARAVGAKGYHEETFADGPYPVA